MKYCSFYRLSDGLFTGTIRGISMSRRVEDIVMPDGCGMVEGRHDHLSSRVDLASGLVVGYQPRQPDGDHEWNMASRRWEKRPDVVKREYEISVAQRLVADLEQRQLRPLRELQIDPSNADARSRLTQIDSQIARQRVVINGETETTGREYQSG